MLRLTSPRIYEKCHSLLGPFRRAALLTVDFEILYLRPESLGDIGTLPQTTEVSFKYLQLADGDITLTSDPYSGGTVVNSPTLVMGVGHLTKKSGTNKGKVPAELLIASRLTFPAKVGQPKTIDDEGLRIPPTPIVSQGTQFNTAVIDALKSHPLTPNDFIPRIENEVAQLLKLRSHLKEELNSDLFDRANVREFLLNSEREFARQLEEISDGVGECDLDISDSESLHLKAEIHDGRVLFDFTGTTPGKNVFITDSSTMGAAIGTFISLMKRDIPINTGVLSRFEIKAPKGSLVNSTFPRPVYLGHTDGINFLGNAVSLALSRIDPKLGWAMSGPSHGSLEIHFKNGASHYFSLPVGVGATSHGPGLDGAYPWRRFVLPHSIELLERKFPIQFIHCGFRANSAGQGKFPGGHGAAQSFKVLDAATISWTFLKPPRKPDGMAGGKNSQDSEIVVQHVGSSSGPAAGKKTTLPLFGKMTLSPGDIVTILTAGGGGYGVDE